MPLVSTTRGYKGRGRFVLRPISGGKPFELGNVTAVNESIEINRTSRQNFQDAAGGELDVEETVTSYTFEATCDDITPKNIAIGMRGSAIKMPSEAVSDVALFVWAGVPAAFRYLPDPNVAPAVAIAATAAPATSTEYAAGAIVLEGARGYLCVIGGTSDSVAPTWPDDLSTVVDGTVTWKDVGPVALVAETDYEVTPHGIRMLSGSADRFHEELPIPLAVGYTRNAQYLIQALVASGEEFEVIWHGLNSNDGGNPMTGRYFRTKFSPTSGFGRHGGTDFATLTLSATVLADESREGAGLSKYQETAMI